MVSICVTRCDLGLPLLPPKVNYRLLLFSNLLFSLQNKQAVSFARGFWSKLLEENKSESQQRTLQNDKLERENKAVWFV